MDRARMRAADADRDQVCALLGEHYAAGRLDSDELMERIGRAAAAKTYGELDALLSDLQHHPVPAMSPPRPDSARTLPILLQLVGQRFRLGRHILVVYAAGRQYTPTLHPGQQRAQARAFGAPDVVRQIAHGQIAEAVLMVKPFAKPEMLQVTPDGVPLVNGGPIGWLH